MYYLRNCSTLAQADRLRGSRIRGLVGGAQFLLTNRKECSGRGLAHTSKELNPPESGEGQVTYESVLINEGVISAYFKPLPFLQGLV